jgi:hypothetical protein
VKSADESPITGSLVRYSMQRCRTYCAQVEFGGGECARSSPFLREAHAQVYISRWFESDLLAAQAGLHQTCVY